MQSKRTRDAPAQPPAPRLCRLAVDEEVDDVALPHHVVAAFDA